MGHKKKQVINGQAVIVPYGVHRELKIVASLKGLFMQQMLTEAWESYKSANPEFAAACVAHPAKR